MTSLIPSELAMRILKERDAVRDLFPGRFRLRMEPLGLAAWVGSVPIEGRDFPVIVTYPPSYPAQPPMLETSTLLPAGCPHVLTRSGGRARLCWIAPFALARHRRWDPQRHTAATVLRAAQRWGLALLVWQTLGVWPVADAWEVMS